MKLNCSLWQHLVSFLFKMKRETERQRQRETEREDPRTDIYFRNHQHPINFLVVTWDFDWEGLCLVDWIVGQEVSINQTTKMYYLNMDEIYKSPGHWKANFQGFYSGGCNTNISIEYSRIHSKSYNICHSGFTKLLKLNILHHIVVVCFKEVVLKCLWKI